MRRIVNEAVFMAALLAPAVLVLSACEGCRNPSNGGSAEAPTADRKEPAAARLYFVSDLAGALEPCGCVKDQLGGMDHLGALVEREKASAKGQALFTVGPTFFMEMELGADKRSQEVAKAETIAASLKTLDLAAVAPGRNDWAAGAPALGDLAKTRGGAELVGANVQAAELPFVKSFVKKVGGLDIGIVGVIAPDKSKLPLSGVTSEDAIASMKPAILELEKKGVHAIVALAAVGRGEAKRIADAYPKLLAVVVGQTGGGGEANTTGAPPERVGDVLVMETANHLQSVAVVDLFVKDPPAPGLIAFADGTGTERTKRREELTARIQELRTKIATWENDKSVARADIEARRKDVEKLEGEQRALDAERPAVSSPTFFRYAMRDVREDLGSSQAVKDHMAAYYDRVNQANKIAFADRKPAPVPKGEPSYVGIDACTKCHEPARKVWDKTKHATAYATLEKQHKEFNLDCVSCHVTGYDRPGGSTVTHVDTLKDVQCEQCHGPGELHAKNPKVAMPISVPSPASCEGCHHPPHVHTFDARAKMAEILGPGHGRPL